MIGFLRLGLGLASSSLVTGPGDPFDAAFLGDSATTHSRIREAARVPRGCSSASPSLPTSALPFALAAASPPRPLRSHGLQQEQDHGRRRPGCAGSLPRSGRVLRAVLLRHCRTAHSVLGPRSSVRSPVSFARAARRMECTCVAAFEQPSFAASPVCLVHHPPPYPICSCLPLPPSLTLSSLSLPLPPLSPSLFPSSLSLSLLSSSVSHRSPSPSTCLLPPARRSVARHPRRPPAPPWSRLRPRPD